MRELTLRFPLDRWSSLYSLADAIARRQREGDQTLLLQGKASLNDVTYVIELELERHHAMPASAVSPLGRPVLGTCDLQQTETGESLRGRIPVPADVFAELLKNLVEYSGIDGIQVLVTLGVEAESTPGEAGDRSPITRLDYAMRSQFAL